MNLFTIKDIKSNSYGAPFASVNSGSATRTVAMAMEDKTSLLARYPSDFELWAVGSMDEKTAALTTETEFIVNLSTLKAAHLENNN